PPPGIPKPLRWSSPQPSDSVHHRLSTEPSGVVQNRSSLSGPRLTTATAPPRTAPTGESPRTTVNGPCSAHGSASLKKCVFTAPPAPVQKMSILSGPRQTADTGAPPTALTGEAPLTRLNGWCPAHGLASLKKWVCTAPSGPVQKMSILSGARLTADTDPPGTPASTESPRTRVNGSCCS